MFIIVIVSHMHEICLNTIKYSSLCSLALYHPVLIDMQLPITMYVNIPTLLVYFVNQKQHVHSESMYLWYWHESVRLDMKM